MSCTLLLTLKNSPGLSADRSDVYAVIINVNTTNLVITEPPVSVFRLLPPWQPSLVT